MLKITILINFFLMLLSLLAAAGFLLKDKPQSQRLLRSLTVRICLAIILAGQLIIWASHH